MEGVQLENNYYPHLKKLVNSEEWKTYEQVLTEDKQRLFSIIETDINETLNLKKIQTQIMQINRILKRPYEIVSEFEKRKEIEGGKRK